AGLVAPRAWLLPALAASAALAAVGGPIQDIIVAVLRQTEVPRPDLPAAVRALMEANNVGLLIARALAPTVFDGIGVAPAVLGCGLCLLPAAITGLVWYGHDCAPRQGWDCGFNGI